MDTIIKDRLRTTLLARLSELSDLRVASAQARVPVALDQQSVGRVSRVDAMQRQAMAQAQDAQRAAESARIENALGRIESDEFGLCGDCGQPIPIKRLELDPSNILCVRCAG